MKKTRVLACFTLWCASLVAAPFFVVTNAVAATSSIIKIAPHSAWIRWLPNALPAAGYLTLQNPSNQAITLVSASSPDYERVSFHQSIANDTTSKMVKIDRLIIPAQSQIALAPGGYHLMLERPTRLIAPGDNVRVVLLFSTGHTLNVNLPVRTSAELY